jgi:glutathionylspermidine synthase
MGTALPQTMILETDKYDIRIWIGITNDLNYYICPTFIMRTSNIPFSLNTDYGSLTNTSLYSRQDDYRNEEIYKKINIIVNDVMKSIKNSTFSKTKIMLTGWDFIEDVNGNIYLLEINCNPATNIQHINVMKEFFDWIYTIDNK